MPFPAHVVEVEVEIRADPTTVWRDITAPGASARWLGGFQIVSAWEVGSPYAIRGTLDGKPYAELGVVRAVEPGVMLRFDHFSRLWRIPDTPENRAVMEMRLIPVPGGTRLALRHQLPDVLEIAPHARFFWTSVLYQLAALHAG